ncbi:MAG: N-acetyl-gamma-glutamyl-phosphate reductase [Firmicutes bacterium]|nr:N-acetyl-gamma-glutamyl-phosphate reductase [Bacillota bacterium]
MKKSRVGIIGVTGYAGAELLRLLLEHPGAEVVKIAARSAEGRPLGEIYPGLAGTGLVCTSPSDSFSECDFVFTALPHGVSMEYIPALRAGGSRVIDLGADFRFQDPELYAKVYQSQHQAADLLAESVYGLVEFYRDEVREARIVGNPGCYPTAVLLGLRPLLAAGIVHSEGIIIDAKSGVSGAGRGLSQDRLFGELNENFRAYKVVGHRHTAEISHYSGADIQVTFTPHLLPLQRGILATMYLTLKPGVPASTVFEVWAEAYHEAPFVHPHPRGVIPELRWVVRSNCCHLGYDYDPELSRVIVVSVIDNLLKGAAGQGVQNFNIMAGLPEETGLPLYSPVV